MKNEVKSSEIKNVSLAKHFDQTFLKFDAQTFPKFVIAIASLVVLAALSMPASADYNFDGFPVVTRTDGTVNGTVFFDSVGWTGAKSLTLNLDVPDGTVKWARLYTGIWGGNPESTYWHNVTFNGIYTQNGLGLIHLEGENDTNPNVWVSGYGKHWWWYNVTNLTNAGETNIAHTWKINGTGQNDGRVYGIVLVVVLEKESMPTIQYWVNDGSDGLNYKTPHNDNTTDFAGTVDTALVTAANLTMVHLTADIHACTDCLRFNGNTLDTSMVDSDNFEINTWNVTDYVEASGNDAWYSRGLDDHVSVTNAILVLERKPDLKITKAWVNWTEDVGCDCTICYNITNIGNGTATASHNTSLFVEGGMVALDYVDVSLAPGASCIRCFNYAWAYTPPSDNIAICADYNNTVVEFDENNWYNTTWMCGDVNGDKRIRIVDVIWVYRRSINPNFPLHEWAADVNGDKRIRIVDVIWVYRQSINPGFGLNCWCD